MKNYHYILLIMVIFIAGCTESSTPVCNKPYILVGTGCCLDQNEDSICDEHIPPISELLSFEGKGSDTTGMFQLEKGLTLFDIYNDGEGYFEVKLLDSEGTLISRLVAQRGQMDGTKPFKVEQEATYLLGITSDGNWEVKVKKGESPKKEEPSEIKLTVEINEATTKSIYLRDPTITITNNGDQLFDNLVIDIELYKDGSQVTSRTDLIYTSGSTSIKNISAGNSVKGNLNLFMPASELSLGTYVLKVIVRQGASAKHLAVVNETFEIVE